MVERASCCVCGETQSNPVVRTWDMSHGQSGEFRFVRCRRCGHVYLDPRPTSEELSHYYPDEYKAYSTAIDDEPNLFVRLNRRYGMAKRCRVITRRRRPGRVLDVGCGSGNFLNEMRSRGWQVQGLDLMPTAARLARERFGLEVYQGPLEGARYPSAHFDAVTMWHVVEHLPDPSATLREIARIVRPGGLVVIETPNVASFDARLFGAHWALWEAPRHLNMFSPQTLGVLLRAHGFENVTARNLIGAWYSAITSLQYIREERRGSHPGAWLGRAVEWNGLIPLQAFRVLMLPYTWLVDRIGAGPSMIVCAERSGNAMSEPPEYLRRESEAASVI